MAMFAGSSPAYQLPMSEEKALLGQEFAPPKIGLILRISLWR
jgi:hypothetical protein